MSGYGRTLDHELANVAAPWKHTSAHVGKPMLQSTSLKSDTRWENFFRGHTPKRTLVPVPTEEVTRVYAHSQSRSIPQEEVDDFNPFAAVHKVGDYEQEQSSNGHRQKNIYDRQNTAQAVEADRMYQTHNQTRYQFWPSFANQDRDGPGTKITNKKLNLVAIIRRTPNSSQLKETIPPANPEHAATSAVSSEFPRVDAKLKVTPKQMRTANKHLPPKSTSYAAQQSFPIQKDLWKTGLVYTVKPDDHLSEYDDVWAKPKQKPSLQLADCYSTEDPVKPVNKPVYILGVSKQARKQKLKHDSSGQVRSMSKEATAVAMSQPKEPKPRECSISFEAKILDRTQDKPLSSQREEPVMFVLRDLEEKSQMQTQVQPFLNNQQPADQQAHTSPKKPNRPKQRPGSEAAKITPKSRYGLAKKLPDLPTYKIGWFKVKFPKLELERLEEIGRGGFGVVYRGFDQKTGKEVAIKYFDKRSLKDSMKRKSLQTEVDALYNCDHPNVIKLIRVAETESCLNFVFDFWGKMNLADFLKNKNLQLKEAKTITKQIIDAIAYLHELGIYNRDLKCENIMIRKNENPKSGNTWEVCLIDFGLAAIDTNRLRRTLFADDEQVCAETVSDDEERRRLGPKDGDICGTRYSMSPEMLKGDEPYHLGPNDIWGIGVLFYFLLTNNYPFGGIGSSSYLPQIHQIHIHDDK